MVCNYRTKLPRPATVKRRAYYARKKQELIDFLGGACAHCGTTKNLTFDHKEGWRTWEPREVHSTKRLRLYTEDALNDLLQLLCASCNSAKCDSAEDAVPF